MKIKSSRQDRIFDFFSYALMSVVVLVILYPLYFVVIASFSDPTLVNGGQVVIMPKGINFDGYRRIFSYGPLWLGYRNTIFYTLTGTLINVTMTLCTAYPLSRKGFYGKKAIMLYMMFTTYFSGGLIPTFLVVKSLHLYNQWPVMIILGMVSVFNVIITRTYIQGNISDELVEASFIDGANHFQILRLIVLPLSKPIIAVMCLYYGVGHWNSYWNAMIYISDMKLYPLQLILRGILTLSQLPADFVQDYEDFFRKQNEAELMKYGMIVVSSAPILMVYPFLQKYLVKGVMIGSIKG